MRSLRGRIRRGDGHIEFFRLELGRSQLREELFYLAYHLHWSWSDIMEMNIGERQFYVRMLVQRIQEENEAYEALGKKFGRG